MFSYRVNKNRPISISLRDSEHCLALVLSTFRMHILQNEILPFPQKQTFAFDFPYLLLNSLCMRKTLPTLAQTTIDRHTFMTLVTFVTASAESAIRETQAFCTWAKDLDVICMWYDLDRFGTIWATVTTVS